MSNYHSEPYILNCQSQLVDPPPDIIQEYLERTLLSLSVFVSKKDLLVEAISYLDLDCHRSLLVSKELGGRCGHHSSYLVPSYPHRPSESFGSRLVTNRTVDLQAL